MAQGARRARVQTQEVEAVVAAVVAGAEVEAAVETAETAAVVVVLAVAGAAELQIPMETRRWPAESQIHAIREVHLHQRPHPRPRPHCRPPGGDLTRSRHPQSRARTSLAPCLSDSAYGVQATRY